MRSGRTSWAAVPAALFATALGLAAPGLAAQAGPDPALIASLSPRGPNETRTTITVTESRGADPLVVLSQRLRAGGGLERGDIVRATAEVQLTTTCVEAVQRCIGHRYNYTPRMDTQVVLASSSTATGGSGADPISGVESKRCNQHRPDRNHHCVFAFDDAVKRVRNVGGLPCPPDNCFVNVVASASNDGAKNGDVVIIGADRPDGSIDQDKARVDAFVERGDVPAPSVKAGGAAMRRTVPIAPSGKAGRRVVRSMRIDGLRKGDVLRIGARQRMGLGHLPYNAFIGTRMIVASGPRDVSTHGFVAHAVSVGGEVTELNGFNCTRGPSAYEDPCTAEKAATVAIRRKLPVRNGDPKPVFINVLVSGAPKFHVASPGDRMVVMGGHIRAERYRVPR